MNETQLAYLEYQLEKLSDSDLVYAWRIRCDLLQYMDDCIYDIEMFNELYHSVEPLEIATRIFYGDFNPHHDYFMFDGYGNPVSFDYLSGFINCKDFALEISKHEELAAELAESELLDLEAVQNTKP